MIRNDNEFQGFFADFYDMLHAGCDDARLLPLLLKPFGENVLELGMSESSLRDGFMDFFTLEGQYDTILMLMNGIGIVGTVSRMDAFFLQVDRLLAPGGQLLCDSSDICYIFEDEDGFIDLTGIEGYYGEVVYTMQYKDIKGEAFPWLFIDPETLREQADAHGFHCDILMRGPHYDYLARITRK